MLKVQDRLRQIALQLASRAQIGQDAKMVWMVAQAGAQQRHRFGGGAEPDIQRPEIRQLLRAEFAAFRFRLKPCRFFLIADAGPAGFPFRPRLQGNVPQGPLIEQEPAPLRGQLRKSLSRIVQSGPDRGRDGPENDDNNDAS